MIGTSANRLLFADQANTAKQNIFIGSSAPPTSVYLGGKGSISLGGVSGGQVNTTVDVTAITNLVVCAGATINSGTNSISLGADITTSGAGDNGVGTLKISASASMFGGNIILVGADLDISNSATVGSALAGNQLVATLTGLSNPSAIAFDPNGNLFVVNTGNDTVSMFTPNALTPTNTLMGLDKPSSLAFDVRGNLFVENNGNDTVSKFVPGATLPSNQLTGLNGPYAPTFDRDGNLFVSNFYNGTVSKFAPGATTASSALTEMSGPSDMAFDGNGNLFVANYGYGAPGTTVSKFPPGAATASDTLSGLTNPGALVFDVSGNLFVANVNGTTVKMFAPGATIPNVTLTGLNFPRHMAFDGTGNLFVTNYRGNTVSKFAPGATTPSETLTGLSGPWDLAFDGSGNLFVSNPGTAGLGTTVSKFALSVAVTSNVTIRPSIANRPIDVGTNTINTLGLTDAELDRITAGKLVIGDASSGVITVSAPVTSNTNLALISGSGGFVSGGGSLGTSGDSITLNTSGSIGTLSSRLLFADQANTEKQNIFIGAGSPPSSVFLGGLGSMTLGGIAGGNTNSTINVTAVTHLVVAPGATINSGTSSVSLAADLTTAGVGNDGIGTLTLGDGASVFGGDITLLGADENIANTALVGSANADNQLITTLTGLNSPVAQAFDRNGNLFVANTNGNTVSMFARGATTATATLTGLNGPVALSFDGSGNLFVANYNIGTVSKFAPGATTPSATLTGLNYPRSLAFDRSGNLFVGNLGNGTVSKFSPGATQPNATLGGLNWPVALGFDSTGNLFVANYYGATVSMFAPGANVASALLNWP